MNSRERFLHTMNFQPVDRVPYFEEGIRREVLQAWGIKKKDLQKMFPVDYREEIIADVDPLPGFKIWPSSEKDLAELKKRLKADDPKRLPSNWKKCLKKWQNREHLLILRVHRGFFLSMGVYDAKRFTDVLFLAMEKPDFVKQFMNIQGEFAAALAEKILKEVEVDAMYFSEPIGSNDGALISPGMYEEIVLKSYEPLLKLADQYGIKTKILLTYANARVLIPSILKFGINCLWACEVNTKAMDYLDLRREFGKNLRLIGGIDLDALRKGKEEINKEIQEKVPALLEQGGYVPLADGRIRKEVPLENYIHYRQTLDEVIKHSHL